MLKLFLFLTLLLLTPFENAEAMCFHAGLPAGVKTDTQERAVASEEKPAKEEAKPEEDQEEVKPSKFPQTYPRPH